MIFSNLKALNEFLIWGIFAVAGAVTQVGEETILDTVASEDTLELVLTQPVPGAAHHSFVGDHLARDGAVTWWVLAFIIIVSV